MKKVDEKWIEIARPFRDKWILFLEKIGETNLKQKSLPQLSIPKIEALFEKKPKLLSETMKETKKIINDSKVWLKIILLYVLRL